MKKVLLYSIKPEHMLNILNGNKTIEVRKRDLPQWVKEALERGDVVEGYGYCTKGEPTLYTYDRIKIGSDYEWETIYQFTKPHYTNNLLNGKVVVKFEVSVVSRFDYDKRINHYTYGNMQVDNMTEFLKNVCITENDIWNYGSNSGFKPLYAHHFTNITLIEPMELREFVSDKLVVNVCGSEFKCYNETASYFARKDQRLTKAPQSFMTAWVKEVGE